MPVLRGIKSRIDKFGTKPPGVSKQQKKKEKVYSSFFVEISGRGW
jgi:hypothetical protein